MSRLSQFLSYSSLVLSITGNTLGAPAPASTGTFVLAGGAGVTLSQVGQTVSIVAGAGAGFSGGVSTGGNTSGSTGVTGTRLVLAGINNITLSQATDANGGTITISGPGALPSFSAGVSTGGNTLGSTGITGSQLVLAGGNNVTLSQSTGPSGATVTISGPNTAAQTVESNTLGISNLGNTSGTSGVISAGQLRLILAGGNSITLSQSINGASATITISGATTAAQTAESNTAGISNLGNTSGTSGVISGNQIQLLLAGGPNVTLSQSLDAGNRSATVSISVAAPGGGATLSEFFFGREVAWLTGTANNFGQGSVMVQPMILQQALSVSIAVIPLTVSVSSSSNSSHAGTLSAYVGIYTKNASTLSLASSGSITFAWTNTSSNSINSLSGPRLLTIPITINATPGNYWLGFNSSTNTANTNWITLANIVQNILFIGANTWGFLGGATATSMQIGPGWGVWSSSSNGAPASIAFSDIQGRANIANLMIPAALLNYTV